MTLSLYIDAIRKGQYPALISRECLDALLNLQTAYGQRETSRVLYEVLLNAPGLTADFSCRLYDPVMKNYWYEFDYEQYCTPNDIVPCVFMETAPIDDAPAMTRLLGAERYLRFLPHLHELSALLEGKGTRIFNIGTLNTRQEGLHSVRLETRVRTAGRIRELLDCLSYSGDRKLVESTLSGLEPYALQGVFTLSFDLYADGISDRIGVYFYPFTSVKETRRLISYLVENGFCLAEKGEDVIRWKRGEMPEHISMQDIHHFKFQFEQDRVLGVKAYLQHAEDFLFFRRRPVS